MVPYIVRRGDYLVKLGFVHGFDADEVWNDPKNDSVRALRKDHNILAPGDVVYVPIARKEGLPITKGITNRYTATVPKVDVTLVFNDVSGPLGNEPFEVRGCAVDGEPKTDGDGRLTVKVAVTVREIEVLFPERHLSFLVRVGDMDPAAEPSGVRKRLENLGFLAPPASQLDDSEDALRGAISSFQGANGIEPTGTLDDATRDALVSKHKL